MDERLLDGQRLSISIQTSDPISEEDAAAFGALREHRLPSSSSNTLEIEPCPEPVHIASRPRMPAPNDAESDTPSCERITIFAMAGAIAVLLVACVVLGAGTGERLESEEPSGQGQATEAILILASAHGSEDKPASARAVLRAAEIAQANDLQHLAASALFLTTNRLALSPYWPLDVAGTPGQVAVSAAAVHPSGLLLALGGSNGSVEVVPVAPASGHLLPDADAPRSVLACAGGVATLSWSRGGRYLAAACTAADTEARSEVMVWEVSGSGASWEGIGLQAAAFANSDDGTMPHRGLRELHALWAGSPVVALAWGVEDRLHGNRTASLAVGCADGALQVWSGIGGVPVVAANTSAEGLQALSWSRDGELLAVGRAGRTLQMWNVSALLNGLTSMPVAAEGGPESIGVTALRFSPVGRWLASGSEDGRVLVWDISRFWLGRLPAAGRKPPVLSPAQTLPAHSMPVSGVSWASETELTTVSTKDRVRVYKLRGDQFQLAHLLGNAYSGFSSVDFSGRMPHVLAAGTASQKASAWVAAVQLGKRGPERFRLSCEANIATMFGAPFSYLAATVSESGERLAISSQEGHVCVWERNRTLFGSGIGPWRTAALLEASDGGHPAGCMQLAFSPDGRALAAAADGGTVFVWRRTASRSWAGQAQPAAPRGPAAKLAWSPDGALLAAATERGAWLWPAALPNAPPAVFVNASHGAATAGQRAALPSLPSPFAISQQSNACAAYYSRTGLSAFIGALTSAPLGTLCLCLCPHSQMEQRDRRGDPCACHCTRARPCTCVVRGMEQQRPS
mmetsp:Transcript_41671/g.98820  ORF Transcript_41671/g.98820 Transcript_41671/m.98820 type:complete len:799 (+) Transcript_41671:918-3314(+)